MRKPTDGQLAISALIVFALWIFVALPLYYGSGNNAAAQQCSARENKDYGFWEKARCDPVAYFTAWLVGFTGVLAVSTIGLWVVTWLGSKRQSRDMQATLDHARQSLNVVERAFVAMTKITNVTIAQQGIIIDYRMELNMLNSGRTPARNYLSYANLGVFDALPTNDFRFPDRRPSEPLSKTVLMAQMGSALHIHLFIQDAVEIYEGRKSGLIWGWTEYDDVFEGSARHRAEFCMLIEIFADPRQTPNFIQGQGVPILTARPWGRYNAHDDSCLYRPGETPVAADGELPPLTQPPPQVRVLPPGGFPKAT